ncbi:hypothetical protein AVEN_261565-1 [Araneus ventricosus]|uniref:Uncharacterized protein n=1 Tax=Araneus ventricosus TaxID=182803 RepID=A0A4Y2EC69_ARAVE|nr:hypothetical protein AVEN_261565-1 [Araneus ventricosus]
MALDSGYFNHCHRRSNEINDVSDGVLRHADPPSPSQVSSSSSPSLSFSQGRAKKRTINRVFALGQQASLKEIDCETMAVSLATELDG